MRQLTLALVLACSAPVTAQPGVEGDASNVDDHTQDIGASIGFDVGGRVTPGGLALGGSFVYRLTDVDWLDTGIAFSFGGGGAACFRNRDDQVLCDHGAVDGFAGGVSLGIRRYLPSRGAFAPFLRGGVEARIVSFSDDDLRGLAIPLWFGGGVKAAVVDNFSIVAGATLRAGVAFMNRDIGIEPQIGLTVWAGVEFALD